VYYLPLDDSGRGIVLLALWNKSLFCSFSGRNGGNIFQDFQEWHSVQPLVPADCACLAAMEVARIRRQFIVLV
jgi:hypothetical protein